MPVTPRPRYTWQLRTRSLELGERTLVIGVVNVTPDSFSDGGQFLSVRSAEERALKLLDEGAAILDIGAESTRPDAVAISATEEQARLLPVVEAVRKARPDAVLSVDTYHSETARAAIEAGAEIINDVSGLLWDERMAEVLAGAQPQPGVVVMHTRGTPREWKTLPRIEAGDVVSLVRDELCARLREAMAAGIAAERMIVDPGFGFGKLGAENYSLLAGIDALHALGKPILVGLSRKGFLAASPQATVTKRLHATIAANTSAILAGAHVVRVHDVAAAVEAAAVADAVLSR